MTGIGDVDVEGGLRAHFRAAGTLAGQRVFVDITGEPPMPYAVVGLVDTTEDPSEHDLDLVLVQLEAIASTKIAARALYGQLRASLKALLPGTTLAPGTVLRGTPVIVPGTTYLPDEDGTPRYIITAQVPVSP